MQVILLETIRNLGKLGEKKTVKRGYGRNYLIPTKKAVYATEKNIIAFEQRRAELEKHEQESLALAEKRANTLNQSVIVISAQASDEGKLYGSIGVNEIKNALMDKALEVSKHEIMMPDGPIYSIGQYTIEIMVHSDVMAHVSVEIVAGK